MNDSKLTAARLLQIPPYRIVQLQTAVEFIDVLSEGSLQNIQAIECQEITQSISAKYTSPYLSVSRITYGGKK